MNAAELHTRATRAGLNAREAYAMLAAYTSPMARVRALTRAERFGSSVVSGVVVHCEGHARDATEFNAATALYRITL